MSFYYTSPWGSSYLLGYSLAAVEQDPETLMHWATQCARVVFAGGLDFHETWERLWLAAVSGGMEHLVAQERIGIAFANARRGDGVAA